MKVTLNGKIKEYSKSLPLKKIIEESCKNSQHIIAEVNETIIKNPLWEVTIIKDGDKIELVTFVGGG